MDALFSIFIQALNQVWITFTHNWPFLILSVLIAVALKLYTDPQKTAAFFMKYKRFGVLGATFLAVTTPLCSCGTTALILGMLASRIPWAPVVAFMVASPLTSPEELVYSAGLFGWPFAVTFFGASIVLGLAGGWLANLFEARGWLAHQNRFTEPVLEASACTCSAPEPEEAAPCACEEKPACSCGSVTAEPVQAASACGCSSAAADSKPAVTVRRFLKEAGSTGLRLLLMFLGFAFIGYFLNGLIPQEWVKAVFGSGNIYSVPLAATLGVPLYINTEGSLPLVRALLDGGMSQGAALAFLITGSGTSVGAIAGALTIARWRVIALVVGTLWVGAIIIGTLVNVFGLL